MAKDAINTNEDIQDVRRRRNVRNEIINTVVEHLVCIYRNVGNPVIGITRQIVTVMGHSYPSLFQDKGDRTNEPLGYGLGGSQGIKQLPQHLLDRVRAILGKCRNQEGSSEDVEYETPRKKGKKKKVYGVDNSKFYNSKNDPAAISAIVKTNELVDIQARESIYEKHRNALNFTFQSSQKAIRKTCRGFFESPVHIDRHFAYMTSCSNLKEVIGKNLKKEINFMELYLRDIDQSIEFRTKMDEIDASVETDFGGSSTFKDIEIMRMAGTHFDKDGKVLFLMETELPPKTSSPFILCIPIISGSFVFELWVDEHKLIGNMDLVSSVTAFLQLAFLFDLKYPKVIIISFLWPFFKIIFYRNQRRLQIFYKDELLSTGMTLQPRHVFLSRQLFLDWTSI